MPRVALVTGGTRGIGAATARALKAAGYKVAATYAGNSKAAQAFQKDTGIAVQQWDIGDFDACALGVKAVEASLGPIDILVNNAGITRDATLHKMTREQWDAVIRTNLDGLFNMCRHVIGGMRERKFGRIISISSINGQKGQFGQTNYSAAKAGIVGLTRTAALEGAKRGILVNAVAPGIVETAILSDVPAAVREGWLAKMPLKRTARPEEIAAVIAFLASDDASYMTGQTLVVDGGATTGDY